MSFYYYGYKYHDFYHYYDHHHYHDYDYNDEFFQYWDYCYFIIVMIFKMNFYEFYYRFLFILIW